MLMYVYVLVVSGNRAAEGGVVLYLRLLVIK
jgi:hypothetical protein